MAQALYRKWRPQSFDDVVGQEHVTTTLKNQIATNRVGHAYLFVGSRGCGKTTSARIFAKEVSIAGLDPNNPRARQIADAIAEGRSLDLIEIDAASHTGVDDIREIRDKVGFQPSELKYKVYIIDEVHMLSTQAFNALLKTLEEPPPHVIFILATTDPQKIPATVLSRCQRFNFKRVPVDKIVGRLRTLCDGENIDADDHALRLIARQATGSLRDAVSLLDQLASSNSLRITPADVREALGATDASTVKALVDALADKNVAAGLDAIQDALDQGADARQIARQMVEHLRGLMQIKVSQGNSGGDLSEAERVALSGQAEKISLGALTRATRSFSAAINDMRAATDAQLPLEMAYLECVVSEPAGTSAGDAPLPAPVTPRPNNPPPNKAAAQAATQETANTPAGGGTAGGANLPALWKQLIEDVNQSSKGTAAIMRSCHLHAIVGNEVQVQANHAFHQERLKSPTSSPVVVASLNKVLKGNFILRVFVGQPAQMDPDEDPVLRAAKRLGGKINDGGG